MRSHTLLKQCFRRHDLECLKHEPPISIETKVALSVLVERVAVPNPSQARIGAHLRLVELAPENFQAANRTRVAFQTRAPHSIFL